MAPVYQGLRCGTCVVLGPGQSAG